MGTFILDHAGYWAIISVMMVGLYIAFSSENLIKRLVGLSLFQTTICLFFVKLGHVDNATAPILLKADMPAGYPAAPPADMLLAAPDPAAAAAGAERFAELAQTYSNPLPHVLMLTAIVVGVATLSLGLALIVRISEAYGSIEADEIRAADIETDRREEADAEARANEAPA